MPQRSHLLRPNQPRSAPAVFVVPANPYIDCADLFPPIFKLGTRNVEGRRCDKMVKHDRVLLAPSETGNGFQVIIVKEVICHSLPRRCTIEWSINQLCR